MGETLVEYSDVLLSTSGGRHFIARACGGPRDDGTWLGWIEFIDPVSGEVIRSGRETTQPNREQTVYWATGLTPVYLEGAFERAMHPAPSRRRDAATASIPPGDGPAPRAHPAGGHPEAILNPFSVLEKGESLLRSQLAALSPWHLVNIIGAYDLSEQSSTSLRSLPASVLIELIVQGVRQQLTDPTDR